MTTTPTAPAAPAGGKVPARRPSASSTRAPRQPVDRQRKAADVRAEALAERPAGADLLRDPATLRSRERVALLRLADALRADAPDLESALADDATDEDKMTAATLSLDLVAEFDEGLEALALDADADGHSPTYAAWATTAGGGPNVEQRVAELFVWYVARLGE